MDKAPMFLWIMVGRGPGRNRYIAAEAPCWKGEIDISLRWINFTIGWQVNGGLPSTFFKSKKMCELYRKDYEEQTEGVYRSQSYIPARVR